MYGEIYNTSCYQQLQQALLEGKIAVQWFFLSGGFGVINDLEPAHSYQATFSYGIARQRKIPYTAKTWGQTLTGIIEHIMDQHPDWRVYVFGSQDYTQFLKSTRHWATQHPIKIIESTGSAGPTRLSPIILEFVEALLAGQLAAFDKRYPERFIKLR